MKDYKLSLRDFGLKATPGRVKLLQFLSTAKKPMSIKEIGKAIGSKSLNQATIYRTLENFESLGLIRQMDFKKDHTYYELADSDHHHVVCTNCGRIEDFIGCNIESLTKAALKQTKNFNYVQEHALELFSLCKLCQ